MAIVWTAEELEEMRRADEEIEREFRENRLEREAAKKRDATAKLLDQDNRSMRQIENKRRYREENKDKHRAYMREYMRKYTARKRAAQGSAAAPGGNDAAAQEMKA